MRDKLEITLAGLLFVAMVAMVAIGARFPKCADVQTITIAHSLVLAGCAR